MKLTMVEQMVVKGFEMAIRTKDQHDKVVELRMMGQLTDVAGIGIERFEELWDIAVANVKEIEKWR